MAIAFVCKDGRHESCRGKVVMGAPGPFTLEKCKCKCHKKVKQSE